MPQWDMGEMLWLWGGWRDIVLSGGRPGSGLRSGHFQRTGLTPACELTPACWRGTRSACISRLWSSERNGGPVALHRSVLNDSP